MTPVESAAAVYDDGLSPRSFREDLEAHLLHGYVSSTPEGFAMARPVPRMSDEADILNPWKNWPVAECDAWLIYLAAGDLRELWARLPFPRAWIGLERRGRLRWYCCDHFESALAKFQSS